MTKGYLALATLLMTTSALTVGQSSLSGDSSRNSNPLSVSMSSLLSKPSVQAEIGLTDRQVVELQTRVMLFPLKHLPDFIEMIRKTADGSEQEAHFNFNSEDMPKFGLSDLKTDQRERLKQLAMQFDPVSALPNKEVADALKLDSAQVTKVIQIWSQYINRVKEEISGSLTINSPAFQKLGDAAKRLKNDDLDKDAKALTRKQYSDSLDELAKVFAESFYEAGYKTDKIKKEFAPKALEVLTTSQKALYKELCGKIVTGSVFD